jgi:hypothetical protein
MLPEKELAGFSDDYKLSAQANIAGDVENGAPTEDDW